MSRLQHISTHVSDRPKPVFFDRSGKRWRLCLATLAAVAFIGIAGASLFVAGLFHDPRFPAIKIDDAERLRQDERNDQLGAQGTLVKTAYAEDKAALPTANVPHRGSMPARVSALPPLSLVFTFHGMRQPVFAQGEFRPPDSRTCRVDPAKWRWRSARPYGNFHRGVVATGEATRASRGN
jgi:hypothetical protein